MAPTTSSRRHQRSSRIRRSSARELPDNVHFESDDRIELQRALQMAREQAEQVAADPYRWKWVVIAVHNAVQASIVSAISGSAKIGALPPKVQEKWLEDDRLGKTLPRERLDRFMNLYSRMKERTGFAASEQMDWSVKRLNRTRNQLLHYLPRGWMFPIDFLIEITLPPLAVVDHVAWNPEWVLWFDQESMRRTRSEYDKLVALLEEHRATLGEAGSVQPG